MIGVYFNVEELGEICGRIVLPLKGNILEEFNIRPVYTGDCFEFFFEGINGMVVTGGELNPDIVPFDEVSNKIHQIECYLNDELTELELKICLKTEEEEC